MAHRLHQLPTSRSFWIPMCVKRTRTRLATSILKPLMKSGRLVSNGQCAKNTPTLLIFAQDKIYGGVEGHWGLFNTE